MSDLGYMEKLLDGVEVEWKTLAEVANFNNGKGHERHIVEDGEYIVVNSRFISTNGKVAKYSDEQICPIFADDILIVMSDLPNGKALAKTFYVEESEKYTLNQRIGKISVKNNELLLPIFLYSYLNRTPQLIKHDNGVTQTNLRKNQILEVKIPILPINIQAEIVRTLDTFTEFTLELTSELTSEILRRKQQYAYYRDQLLTFEDDKVKLKALGKVATINTGQKPSNILDVATAYDYINAGTSRSGYSASSNCEGDTVTTPSRGQGGIGYVGYQRKPFWLGPLCYRIKSVNEGLLINQYLFYFLQSRSILLLALKKEGGVPAVNKSDLAKLEIPIPSILEQKRIVDILDKFEALTTSLTEGLPREITLRQQQYEYYRELLLSFPETEVEDHD